MYIHVYIYIYIYIHRERERERDSDREGVRERETAQGQAAQEAAGTHVDAAVEGPARVWTDGGRVEAGGYQHAARGVSGKQIRQAARRACCASKGS